MYIITFVGVNSNCGVQNKRVWKPWVLFVLLDEEHTNIFERLQYPWGHRRCYEHMHMCGHNHWHNVHLYMKDLANIYVVFILTSWLTGRIYFFLHQTASLMNSISCLSWWVTLAATSSGPNTNGKMGRALNIYRERLDRTGGKRGSKSLCLYVVE